CARKENSLDVW
nr:immunoglobulin heavy chain junction region [Macaca mulatta]